jgi:carbon-monoxide dehydrogenase medium subunit
VEGERITEARIALTGVGDRPWRERGVEQELLGQKKSSGLFDSVAGQIAAGIDPPTDIHASAAYRRSLAHVLTRRALSEASNQARNGN